MEVRITAVDAIHTPVLWSFLRVGPHTHSDNNEIWSLTIPDDGTMLDVWHLFTPAEREDMCKNISNLPRRKYMHQGTLALHRIADVIDWLCICKLVTVSYGFHLVQPSTLFGTWSTS